MQPSKGASWRTWSSTEDSNISVCTFLSCSESAWCEETSPWKSHSCPSSGQTASRTQSPSSAQIKKQTAFQYRTVLCQHESTLLLRKQDVSKVRGYSLVTRCAQQLQNHVNVAEERDFTPQQALRVSCFHKQKRTDILFNSESWIRCLSKEFSVPVGTFSLVLKRDWCIYFFFFSFIHLTTWRDWRKQTLTTYDANIRTLLCLPQGHWGSLSRLGSYSVTSSTPEKPKSQRVELNLSLVKRWWSCVFDSLIQRRTCFLRYAVVQTSRGEVPLSVDSETGLSWRLSCAALCSVAALCSHQGIGWIEKLSIRHRLKEKN